MSSLKPVPVPVPREVIDEVVAALDENLDEFIAELMELCRFRSRRWEDEQMQLTAEWLKANIESHQGTAELVPWELSHPYVLAEMGNAERRLLHFTHYDVEVEPTGDEDQWLNPPYEPAIRDGAVYARGIGDDKGAIMSRIHAVAAWIKAGYEPPVTAVFMIEGKKALHSPGMGSFAKAHAHQLRSHGTLWENSWVDGAGRPLLKLGEKGILIVQLRCTTLNREVTSQNAALLNAATTRLVKALATLQDEAGDPAIEGFFDGVRPITEAERELLNELTFAGDFLRERTGVTEFRHGIDDKGAVEATRIIPTLVISGIEGGNNSYDVTLGVPGEATAKLEFRLVNGQDPVTMLGHLRAHLDAPGYSDIEIDVIGQSSPNGTDFDNPFVELCAETAERVYKTKPVIEPYTTWIGNQGSVGPRPVVGIGVSRVESSIDGPNENITIEDYRNGTAHVIEIMAAMASAEGLTEVEFS